MKRSFTLLMLLLMLSAMPACKKQGRDLRYMQEKMIVAGYGGKYKRPEKPSEKMFLTFLGIEELMIYESPDFQAIVAKLKEGKKGEDLLEQAEAILGWFESPGNSSIQLNIEELRQNSRSRGQYVIIWSGNGEKGILRIFNTL